VLSTLTAYEAWVDTHTPTVAAARVDKHQLMAAGAFAFLRGSYPRRAQRVVRVAGQAPGPVVNAVGALHVENFGTWRDPQGRTVWGINDLDEADQLPAAFDLVRLATSALLATQGRAASLSAGNVIASIMDGYAASPSTDGRPVVLDGPPPQPLDPLLRDARAEQWWAKLGRLKPAADLPEQARVLLAAALPKRTGAITYLDRVAGMGSRDHLRVVAVTNVAGSPIVREVKALRMPASWWLNGVTTASSGAAAVSASVAAAPDGPTRDGATAGQVARAILRRGRRSPDPTVRITPGWVVGRLAPWSDRIELADLHRKVDTDALLAAMGAESANLHLATTTPSVLCALTTPRGHRWIKDAAQRMLDDTCTDWRTWRTSLR